MKNSAWILNCVVVAFILAMSGCKESFTVVTTLFTDGSCDRTITVSSDTIGIPSVAFPLPIDSTWEMSWKAPVEKGEKYLFTAKKHFLHIDSMRQAYARIHDSTKIRIDVSVEKEFRWFYTYFTYKEKYGSFNPLRSIPLSDFMTDAEVQRYLAGERSDSLKKKRDAWETHNVFEVYYQGLLDGARNLHHPSLPPSLIESKKEELYSVLMSSGTNDAVGQTAAVLGTQVVRKLSKELDACVNDIMQKSAVASRADGDYVSTVVMPGTILDTNAGEVKGNNVVWRFSDEYLSMADFEMRAESRSANVWPMALTGLVVLLLIFLPLGFRRFRERQLAVSALP
jgi:hypothetical protein